MRLAVRKTDMIDPNLPEGASLDQINGVKPTRITFRHGYVERMDESDEEESDPTDNSAEPREDIEN